MDRNLEMLKVKQKQIDYARIIINKAIEVGNMLIENNNIIKNIFTNVEQLIYTSGYRIVLTTIEHDYKLLLYIYKFDKLKRPLPPTVVLEDRNCIPLGYDVDDKKMYNKSALELARIVRSPDRFKKVIKDIDRKIFEIMIGYY